MAQLSAGKKDGPGVLSIYLDELIDRRLPFVYHIKLHAGREGFTGPLAGIDYYEGIGTTTNRGDALFAVLELGAVDISADYPDAGKR